MSCACARPGSSLSGRMHTSRPRKCWFRSAAPLSCALAGGCGHETEARQSVGILLALNNKNGGVLMFGDVGQSIREFWVPLAFQKSKIGRPNGFARIVWCWCAEREGMASHRPVDRRTRRLPLGAGVVPVRPEGPQSSFFADIISANDWIVAGKAMDNKSVRRVRVQLDRQRTILRRVSRSRCQHLIAPRVTT